MGGVLLLVSPGKSNLAYWPPYPSGEYHASISWLPTAACHGMTPGGRLDLAEELLPDPRVVGVGQQATAAGLGVGHVARVQVERGVLSPDEVRRADRVVGHALVAEGGESERMAAARRGCELPGDVAAVPALVADAVVIGLARPQAAERGVHVVLLDGQPVERRGDRVRCAGLPDGPRGVWLRTSAGIGPLRSNGEWPTRMNGLFTGPATCQPTDIEVVGSAP